MIATDGRQTIANAPVRRKHVVKVDPNRGPQANGQEWNDDRCACGGKICDSPAGDKCWDCFNFDPDVY